MKKPPPKKPDFIQIIKKFQAQMKPLVNIPGSNLTELTLRANNGLEIIIAKRNKQCPKRPPRLPSH